MTKKQISFSSLFGPIAVAAALFFSVLATAQKTTVYTTDLSAYQRGLELFEKQKYGAAQRQFSQAHRQSDRNSEVGVNSRYYAALCALELFNRDAEYLLSEFVRENPESPKVKLAYFQLGRYNYQKQKWEKSLDWFAQVDMYDLSAQELAEFHFSRGYALFQLGEFDEALKAFYEIKDVDTDYTAYARYYYAHIAYMQGNYETALLGFQGLQKDEKLGAIVPYYITQIYYHQNKNDELLAYAPEVLTSAHPKRAAEISRLIGEAYYRTGRYAESLPYLEGYKTGGNQLSNEDKYQLGFAYYQSGNYEEAEKIFKTFTESQDVLAQSCYYHLADCYLKTGNKAFARNAFLAASRMDFDPELQETALFNYAMLSTELSYDPYNGAIGAFEDYVKKYPEGERTELAYAYMLNVYLTTKNYDAAIASLESLPKLDIPLQEAYQQVTYNRAVELFNNSQYSKAISFFEKSRKYSVDRELANITHFWTGEAHYKQSRFAQAVVEYETFIYGPGAILTPEFNQAHYNIGYSFYREKDFDNAITWFRKFADKKDLKDKDQRSDAYQRTADSYVVKSQEKDLSQTVRERYLAQAEDFYQRAIKTSDYEVDYAMYQRAKLLGYLGNNDEKIGVLETLTKKFPESEYCDDGMFDLARAYELKLRHKDAIGLYERIINEHPNSRHVKNALLNTGLIFRNTNRTAEAKAIFWRIVTDYAEGSRQAMVQLRNIAIEENAVDAYTARLREKTDFNLSEAWQDSSVFAAAELLYTGAKYVQARGELTKYLSRFSPGIFATPAAYYKADCERIAGDYDAAIKSYVVVINRPISDFTEGALAQAAALNFHLNRYEDANANFMMLEKVAEKKEYVNDAFVGQMRCFYQLSNHASAMEYARKVLAADQIEKRVREEARLILGKSAIEMGDLNTAYKELEQLVASSGSIKTAEAKYLMAWIKFKEEDYKSAEAQVFELVNLGASSEYWVAKGLILLADVYIAMDNTFQAKATLESIVENYEGKDELKGIAQAKLNEIIAAEAVIQFEGEEKVIEIPMYEAEFENDTLFDQDDKVEEPDEIPDPNRTTTPAKKPEDKTNDQ